ncbi:RHS repeat-associated core domain-containing protein [Streptomyces sp. NPDC059818]|uniref:RHS repeat-associated core domain-containing protein n=1 Tax=unclassified Streptomyces TaxID=2593676 RepID=UPI00364C2BFB
MSAIAVGTLAITRRKQLPFGQLRSSQSTAFGNRGFVGGTNDPTGLTHLGAREYDPTLGRFLSVDPIIDTADPAQMNAYSYAHNSPLTRSDPDGLRPDGPAGGATYNDDRWAEDRGMNAGYTYKSGKWVWHQTPKSWFDPRYQAYRANPSSYKVHHYNAAEATSAYKKAEADRVEREKKAAAAQRKKDGIWGSIKKGNWGNAWDNTVDAFANPQDHWRGWLETGAFVVCVASMLGCVIASAVVVGAKYVADYREYGSRVAGENFIANATGAVLGLGLAKAGGLAMSSFAKGARVGKNLPAGRHAATGSGRHAAPKGGRHSARPDQFARGGLIGGNAVLGQAGCGTTMNAPSWCG